MDKISAELHQYEQHAYFFVERSQIILKKNLDKLKISPRESYSNTILRHLKIALEKKGALEIGRPPKEVKK